MKLPRIACISVAIMLSAASSAWAVSPAEAEAEAEEYLQTWEDRGREACKDNERGCAAAGHALDRAAAAYEKAGRLNKAMVIRKMIMDPQWHLDYTDYGRTAMFSLSRNYQAITEFYEAAQLAETAVRRFAKSEEAPDALVDAFILRLGIGEIDRAIEDFELFSKNYGGKRPGDLAKLVLALGTKFSENGRSKDALVLLEKQMSFVDRHGNIDTRTLVHALLGRLYTQAGNSANAAREFKLVLAVWDRPEVALKQLNTLGGTELEQNRRLAKLLMVMGEAMFFFAEQKRVEAEAIRYPEYQGQGDKDSVLAFVNTKIVDWIKKRRVAIEAAEESYQKILQLQPVPPPRWVIASASRVGLLWSTFVTEFRRAPMPKAWNSSGTIPGTDLPAPELKKAYIDKISEASEPQMQRATAAFKVCADYSLKFQYADENSRACVAWLEKNHRKQWIPVEELLPAPKHTAIPIPTLLILPSP